MTDVNSMKGKRAIVTGGGTGLGAATALGLARRGIATAPHQVAGLRLHLLGSGREVPGELPAEVPQVETLGDFLRSRRALGRGLADLLGHPPPGSRVGKPWPRNPLTSELLDRCRVTLSTEQFEHAWAIGPTLSRAQLTVDALP